MSKHLLTTQQHLFIKNLIDKYFGFEENHKYSPKEQTQIKKALRIFCDTIKKESKESRRKEFLNDYLDFLVLCSCGDSQ